MGCLVFHPFKAKHKIGLSKNSFNDSKGLQLFGKVRLNELDPIETLLESLQIAQNKFARFVHGSNLMDRINTKLIFKETNLLSVNQLNAQIKLTEVWKSQNVDSYPIQWTKREEVIKRSGLKSSNKPDLVINGTSLIQSNSFINDAARVWNTAPQAIKECKSIGTVKKLIRKYIVNLPT